MNQAVLETLRAAKHDCVLIVSTGAGPLEKLLDLFVSYLRIQHRGRIELVKTADRRVVHLASQDPPLKMRVYCTRYPQWDTEIPRGVEFDVILCDPAHQESYVGLRERGILTKQKQHLVRLAV